MARAGRPSKSSDAAALRSSAITKSAFVLRALTTLARHRWSSTIFEAQPGKAFNSNWADAPTSNAAQIDLKSFHATLTARSLRHASFSNAPATSAALVELFETAAANFDRGGACLMASYLAPSNSRSQMRAQRASRIVDTGDGSSSNAQHASSPAQASAPPPREPTRSPTMSTTRRATRPPE